MLNLFANGLVIVGLVIQAASLLPVYHLLSELPVGKIRTRWYFMTVMILVFLVGYMAYLVAFWSAAPSLSDLIVPVVFLMGGLFVWLSCNLSLQSINLVRRNTQLEEENITDTLPGVYNRRYLDRRLEEELFRARRYKLPLSVLLIDVDHLKEANDSLGHQAGDLVLNHISQLALAEVRASDIVARYGGDEFMIIAPNTALAEAGRFAERLRLIVQHNQPPMQQPPGSGSCAALTISIGVAACSSQTLTGAQLFQDADEALYRAKQSGRNHVVIHTPL